MKVSVVVTVLNEASNIQRVIKALLRQTMLPDEVIIVDGGSADGTVGKVYSLLTTDYSKKGVGVFSKSGNRSVGRNYGIRKARNSIIAITDAGGYPKRDWLEKIIEPFKNPGVKVVSGYYKSLARTSFEKSITPYFLVMPEKVTPGHEFLPSSRSVAFRKEIWEKVGGYPEQYSHNEDLVFDYNIKKAGFAFYNALDAIVYWQPSRNLRQAFRQFFRFALGDAESEIDRPKVKYIFLRYAVGVLLILLRFYEVFALFSIFYFLYSIFKNFRYVKEIGGLFWLPVIQATSDIAVMSGHICGMIKKYGLGSNTC